MKVVKIMRRSVRPKGAGRSTDSSFLLALSSVERTKVPTVWSETYIAGPAAARTALEE
jgi:hypothetical protein